MQLKGRIFLGYVSALPLFQFQEVQLKVCAIGDLVAFCVISIPRGAVKSVTIASSIAALIAFQFQEVQLKGCVKNCDNNGE